jgi:hypothetical protein
MARVKGSAVLSTLRYVREKYGEGAVDGILASLPEEDRQAIGTSPLVSAWYPMPVFLRFMEEAERQLGPKDPELARNMGRASAEYGLSTVYKVFFKVGSPEFIIGRATRVFGS